MMRQMAIGFPATLAAAADSPSGRQRATVHQGVSQSWGPSRGPIKGSESLTHFQDKNSDPLLGPILRTRTLTPCSNHPF